MGDIIKFISKYSVIFFYIISTCSHATWYQEDTEASVVVQRSHHKSIPSTQLLAKEEAEAFFNGTKVFSFNQWGLHTADEQTGGIGTNSRTWVSPPNYNIYATYTLVWPEDKQSLLFHISQIVTLSIAQTLENLGFAPKIKWINDLLLSEKKMCGVLCQSLGGLKESGHVILLMGIGVNVNMPQELCNLDQPVTSLKVESEKDWDKDEILGLMNERLLKNMRVLVNQGFVALFPEIQKRMAYIGKEVTVQDDHNEHKGIFEGINNEGAMILNTDGKKVILINGRIVKKPN